MRKHAETFHTNKGCKLAIVIFIPTLPFFKIETCGTPFKRYLHKSRALHTATFYMKISHFNIVFHMT